MSLNICYARLKPSLVAMEEDVDVQRRKLA